MMQKAVFFASLLAAVSAQKAPTPPPPPADGNYPPPPPDWNYPPPPAPAPACTADSQCRLPCPMGQSGACRMNSYTGVRACECAAPSGPLMPPLIAPQPPAPAPGSQGRCWTASDGKTTQYTNGYPGAGWTMGCAPAPAPPMPPAPQPAHPPPPPDNYPNSDAPTAANGARCGGFMEASTLSPRCICGDAACQWATGGWACSCQATAPTVPTPAPAADQQACLSCVAMGMFYGENGLCRPATSDFPSDGFRMCHDYGRSRYVQCCASLMLPAVSTGMPPPMPPTPPPPADGNYPPPPPDWNYPPPPPRHTMCPAGTASDGAGGCNDCPAGMYQGMMGADTCITCMPGFFTPNSGSMVCTMCPAGTFLPQAGGMMCNACPMNTFSMAGSAMCTPCAAGSTAPTGASTCMKGH